MRNRSSGPEGRSATTRLASEEGQDGFGGRWESGKQSHLEDRTHHWGTHKASNLLVEVGADGTGISRVGPVGLLG